MNIYIASPVSTYTTSRYDKVRELVHTQFPDDVIYAARGMYANSEDWISQWPTIAKRMDICVYFAAADGTYGRGVYHELESFFAAHKPVYYARLKTLVLETTFPLHIINNGESWIRYAKRMKQLNDPKELSYVPSDD